MVNVFKWRHFQGVIILQCVRWYLKYGINYRDLEEMMKERSVVVDHTTLYRWVIKYAHELKKRSSWYARNHGFSWRVDETYVKVKGQWKYLYRAIDKHGDTIDFYLSHTRHTKAAKRFLSKALKVNKHWVPSKINTDQNPTYNQAIAELKVENEAYAHIFHRKVKYLNNRIESDHGKLKRLIKPMLGFKTMKSAYSTITGYEYMRMFKKGQFDFWMKFKNMTEAQFIGNFFDVCVG